MPATDLQVQQFVDQRIRPVAERSRELLRNLEDIISTIDDVYAALTQETPTWTDTRQDGPPHLLTPSDVLAINTFVNDMKTAIRDNAQLPIVLKACVRFD